MILVTCRKTFFQILSKTFSLKLLEILNMTFEKVDIDKKEIYILSDFNINMYHNNRYIVHGNNTISSKFLLHDVKNYQQFFTMYGLKQLKSISAFIFNLKWSYFNKCPFKSFPNKCNQCRCVWSSTNLLLKRIPRIKTGSAHKYLN